MIIGLYFFIVYVQMHYYYFYFSFVGPGFCVPNIIAISNSGNTGHHEENVIVNSVHTDLSSVDTRHSSGGEHQLQNRVVDSGEVARSARLVFFGAKGKGVHVDTAVRGTGVVLEGLNNIEVRTLTLGEAVLAVKLELGSDHRVLTPAVHVKGRLCQHEGTSIR